MPSSLPPESPTERQRARDLYLIGLGLVMLGAWVTEFLGSLLPLAMGASAGLLLSLPLMHELLLRVLERDRS